MSRTPDTCPLLRRWRILRKKTKTPPYVLNMCYFFTPTHTLCTCSFSDVCFRNVQWTEGIRTVRFEIQSLALLDQILHFFSLLTYCCVDVDINVQWKHPHVLNLNVCVCDFSVCLTHWFTSHTCGMSVTWAYWSGRERGPFSRLDFYLPNPR